MSKVLQIKVTLLYNILNWNRYTISSSVSHFEIFFLPWILSTLISKCLISDNQQIKIQKRKGQRAICCLIRWQELNNKMLFVLSLRHQDQPNILVSLIVPDFTLSLSLIYVFFRVSDWLQSSCLEQKKLDLGLDVPTLNSQTLSEHNNYTK